MKGGEGERRGEGKEGTASARPYPSTKQAAREEEVAPAGGGLVHGQKEEEERKKRNKKGNFQKKNPKLFCNCNNF